VDCGADGTDPIREEISRMNKAGSLALVVALVTCGIGAGTANPADPVQTQFQTYTTARKANDLAGADAALQAALAASVAHSGDGGRTAELALELARFRLLRGEFAAAVAPAREAVRIADQRGLAAGIDADLARLTLARAELRGTDARDADQRLLRLLEEIPYSPDNAPDLLAAAFNLAQTADEAGQAGMARQAWAQCGSLSRRQPRPDPVLIATAQVGEARAGLLERLRSERRLALSTSPPSGESSYGRYATMLLEAAGRVEAEAMQWQAQFEPAVAQRVYGEANVWLGVVKAKLKSEDRKLADAMRQDSGSFDVAPRADVPLCAVRQVTEPMPAFPKAQRVRDGVGAVVLKMRFDDTGRVLQLAVVTSAGGPEFEQSVADVASSWRIVSDDTETQGSCRMARDRIITVLFVYS
jgi:hypothetical protein